MIAHSLPAAFASLQPFTGQWALATEYERMAARRSASPQDIQAFYSAVLPHLQDMLTVFDTYPLGKIPPEISRLFHMAMSLAEVAPHVEFYKCSPAVPHAFDEQRLIGDHCSAAD